jgi:nucleotide-binding universal stress UspA family protein
MAPPALLCFDGSPQSRSAIEHAGQLLGGGPAVVVTAWESADTFVGFDPVSAVSETVGRLAGLEREMDEIGNELAEHTAAAGAELAHEHGFEAEARAVEGKPWSAIVRTADEVDARIVVLGSRGLSRVESAVLGSVSHGVVQHCTRPVLVVPKLDGT